MNVPFFKQSKINLSYKSAFLDKVVNLFDGTTSLVNGYFTKNFEKDFSQFVGSRHCSFVSNGLDALILALLSLDVCKGDSIIVPCHTYIATWLAPLRLGCKLIPVPVREDNLLLDVDQLGQYLTKDVKVVMPVHLYGNVCDIKAIKEYQSQFNFYIVEDAAQAHGAKLANDYVGNLGDLTCFSFYPTKNLGAIGEAGAITTNNTYLYEKVNSLRNYGRSPEDGSLNLYPGINNRGDEIQACFLNEKLKNMHAINDQRMKLIQLYAQELSEYTLKLNLIDYSPLSAPHLAIVSCRDLEIRDKLSDFLAKKQIQTAIHYSRPCHKQPFISSRDLMINNQTVLHQSEQISQTILSLPLSEVHEVEEIKFVCDSIKEFCLL